MTALRLGVLVAICSGCPATPDPVCSAVTRGQDQFLIPGVPAQILIGVSEQCRNPGNTRIHVADKVTAEVFNPLGEAVAFTVSPPERSSGNAIFENTAVVSFTPDRPGSWQVRASFEPSIGNPSLTIEAIEWRGDAGWREVPVNALPEYCEHYAITDLGTVVCSGSVNFGAPTLFTSRDQQFSGIGFTVEHNAVWRLNDVNVPMTLQRLVDDGGLLQMTHEFTDVGSSLFGPFAELVADQGDVWVAPDSRGGLARAHPESDGGLSFVRYALPFFRARAIASSAEGIHAIGTTNTGAVAIASVLPDGGQLRFPMGFVQFAGSEPGRLWIWGPQQLTAVRVTGESLIQTSITLPTGFDFGRGVQRLSPSTPLVPLSAVIPAQPLLKPDRAVARFDGTSIWLENYDEGPGYWPTVSADSRHAFARSKDGATLKVFDR
jgi:hypothetical protein